MDLSPHQKIVLFSDTHPYNSGPTIVANNTGNRLISVGDQNAKYRSSDDYRNELVYQIEQARGLSQKQAIDYAAQHHPVELFEQTHRESILARLTQEKLNRLYDSDLSDRILDISGNSNEKWSAVADSINNKFNLGSIVTTETYLTQSRAFNRLNDVDYGMAGDMMFIAIPYSEKAEDWRLYKEKAANILKMIAREKPREIVILGHEHPAPETIFGKHAMPAEMEQVFNFYMDLLTGASEAEVSFVSGHIHKFVAPYKLDNGVTMYSIGWNEGTKIMRTLEIDPQTGEKKFVDIPVEVSDAELEFLDALSKGEISERGYVRKIQEGIEAEERKNGTYSEEADTEEPEAEEAEPEAKAA